MKRYLLDTSLVAAFLHGRPNTLALIEPLVRNRQAGTSMLVYGEVIEYLKGQYCPHKIVHKRNCGK